MRRYGDLTNIDMIKTQNENGRAVGFPSTRAGILNIKKQFFQEYAKHVILES